MRPARTGRLQGVQAKPGHCYSYISGRDQKRSRTIDYPATPLCMERNDPHIAHSSEKYRVECEGIPVEFLRDAPATEDFSPSEWEPVSPESNAGKSEPTLPYQYETCGKCDYDSHGDEARNKDDVLYYAGELGVLVDSRKDDPGPY